MNLEQAATIGHFVIIVAFAVAFLGGWLWFFYKGWVMWLGLLMCSSSPLIGLLGAAIAYR